MLVRYFFDKTHSFPKVLAQVQCSFSAVAAQLIVFDLDNFSLIFIYILHMCMIVTL